MVSEKHCNFLINTGGATAADIEGLGETVRRRVREHSGVELEWEIDRVGRHRAAWRPRHDAPRRRADGRPVGRARGVAGQRATPAPGRSRSAATGSTRIDAGRRSAGRLLAALRARRRVQRAARPLRRGRARAGPARTAGIPYTHSGVLASALAMDKPMAKLVFAAAGLRCPEGMDVELARARRARPAARPPLRRQAGRRGLQRRRAHRARPDDLPAAHRAATISTRGSACWSSASSPAGSSPARVMGDRPLGRHRDPAARGLLRLPRQVHGRLRRPLVPAPVPPERLRARCWTWP